jgi:hypothetical protein
VIEFSARPSTMGNDLYSNWNSIVPINMAEPQYGAAYSRQIVSRFRTALALHNAEMRGELNFQNHWCRQGQGQLPQHFVRPS